MANKPYFENRSGTDVAGLQAALVRYFQQLQRYVDDLEVTIIQEAAEVSEGVGVTEGCIFSMIGPLDSAAPVVAYDFTRFDSALSTADNLINANGSGDSALDLVSVGGSHIGFVSSSGDTTQAPYSHSGFAGRVDGGALICGQGTSWAETSGSPAGVRLLGAMSAEWLGHVSKPPTGGDVDFFDCGAVGETEATNTLYELFWDTSIDILRYVHESGAGVNSLVDFFIHPTAKFLDTVTAPAHYTLTRSGAGTGATVRLYINGRLAAVAGTPGGTALPTGGTSANLRIGVGSSTDLTAGDVGVKFAVLGFRLFSVELNAAQVRESYCRTMFGLGAP